MDITPELVERMVRMRLDDELTYEEIADRVNTEEVTAGRLLQDLAREFPADMPSERLARMQDALAEELDRRLRTYQKELDLALLEGRVTPEQHRKGSLPEEVPGELEAALDAEETSDQFRSHAHSLRTKRGIQAHKERREAGET